LKQENKWRLKVGMLNEYGEAVRKDVLGVSHTYLYQEISLEELTLIVRGESIPSGIIDLWKQSGKFIGDLFDSGVISKHMALSIMDCQLRNIEPDPHSRDRYLKKVKKLQSVDSSDMHKNAHSDSQYACPRCSKLSSLLSEMASNPPGFDGVETPQGRFGNAHVDLGWVTAVNMLAHRLKE
jgi:hypothetical protein